jgi:outer membrane lipoprotein-sorting protein
MRERVIVRVACAVSLLLTAAPVGASVDWNDVVQAYAGVRDYTATYAKEERAISNGELQTMRLSFRVPLDVRLEWLDAHGTVDQIAVYRQGVNQGKLLARRRGLFGSIIGTIRLDPREPRALEDSRHPITEVGLGHIVDVIARGVQQRTLVVAGTTDDVVDGVRAERVDVDAMASTSAFGVDGARHVRVWVDRALNLPIKLEVLNDAGAMLERHRFKDLRLNVGLSDAVFTL